MESPNETLLLSVGRLEGKVDALLAGMKQHQDQLEDQEKRINNLEQTKAWLIGAAAAAGGSASFLVDLFKGVH
jgi:hypothetical protein